MRGALLTIAACIALAVAGCGSSSDSSTAETAAAEKAAAAEETTTQKPSQEASKQTKPKVTVPSGPPPKQLVKKDLIEGSGPAAKAGDEVTVQYVGVGYKSKEQFDASWDRGEPFTFSLGAGQVIPGWEEGVAGMKPGGRRELIIPPELAYGPAGAPPAIGPNEALVFVVDLVAAK